MEVIGKPKCQQDKKNNYQNQNPKSGAFFSICNLLNLIQTYNPHT